MKHFILLLSAALLTACSSSSPNANSNENYPAPTIKEPAKTSPAPAHAAPMKAMKCKYDTDCMVQNSCVKDKCKLTGTECRFRSDCPSPHGTCVNNKCEFAN